MSGNGATITELAAKVGVSRSYFTRIFRLSFLAPEITTRQSSRAASRSELTAKQLSLHICLPNAWPDQVALLGIT